MDKQPGCQKTFLSLLPARYVVKTHGETLPALHLLHKPRLSGSSGLWVAGAYAICMDVIATHGCYHPHHKLSNQLQVAPMPLYRLHFQRKTSVSFWVAHFQLAPMVMCCGPQGHTQSQALSLFEWHFSSWPQRLCDVGLRVTHKV